MRELWSAARGRIDVELIMPVFVMGCFAEVSKDTLNSLNPLRRMEQGPPPEKTPEAKEQESKLGWKLIRQFFSQKRKR